MEKFLKGMHFRGPQPQAAFAFQADAAYTAPVVGDLVKINGNGTVILCVDGDPVHGTVDVVRHMYGQFATPMLTVTLRGRRAESTVAKAAITAGAWVVAGGLNTVRAYVEGTDKAPQILGFALTGATAAAEVMEVVYL